MTGAGALWTGRVLRGLVVAFLLFDGGIKVIGLPMVEETMAALGYPPGLGLGLGVLTLAIAALYAVPRTAVLGAGRWRRICAWAARSPRTCSSGSSPGAGCG